MICSSCERHRIEFSYDGEQHPVPVEPRVAAPDFDKPVFNAIKISPLARRIWFEVVCSASQALFRSATKDRHSRRRYARMVEAFHRARNAGQVQGTGLGLAIIKRAVDAHGGKISLTSQVDVGTTFTLMLPLIPPEQYKTEDIPMFEIPSEE